MWTAVTFTAILLTVLYCLLIMLYNIWFVRLPYFRVDKNYFPKNTFSIVIPARDEEDVIEKCVLSVLQNDYPAELFEVIVVDDFSTDNTAAIVQRMQQQFSNLKLLQLKDFVQQQQNSYKKKSIETAISFSSFEWIITTDADCETRKKWLRRVDACIQVRSPVFLAAPVKFSNNGSFISIFQCLDFMSLQGITAASVSAGFLSMCNGANLAYKKETFYAVNGFKGIDNIASGDDMLLMHKIKKAFPGKAHYLFSKEAIVTTQPMHDIKSFINQRIRWASKATSYEDKKILPVLLLVYFVNVMLLILPVFGLLHQPLFFLWLILLLSKTFFEILFMLPVAAFFGEGNLLWWFPVMQPFHILYTVVSGWLGKFGSYEWKGRRVK